MTVLRPFLDRWRLCAVLASAALLSIAHAFETFGGLPPCPLCLRQREAYWAAIVLGVVFMVLVRTPGGPRWREATNWILGLVFLVGAGVAVFHAGGEWKLWPLPASCGVAGAGEVSAAALDSFLQGAQVRVPRCDEPPWVFAGLSMAGWNAVASFSLAVLSVLAALRERSKR